MRQLKEWQLYYEAEPFGHELAFIRSGIIAAAIYNSNVTKKSQLVSPMEFVPTMYKPKKKKQTWQEMKAIMRLIATEVVEKNNG